MVRAPLISFGAHSAVKMATKVSNSLLPLQRKKHPRAVAELGPIPRPNMNRAINMAHQLFVNACHIHATAETTSPSAKPTRGKDGMGVQ